MRLLNNVSFENYSECIFVNNLKMKAVRFCETLNNKPEMYISHYHYHINGCAIKLGALLLMYTEMCLISKCDQ